ncbi:MAG: IS30 family transposase, partial [Lactococcus lactis]|nr:IS30 family transposase [Lactococcus lactis]
VLYQKNHPLEKVPCFKTIYNYIHRGNFFIRPIDLPVMVTLKSRRNKHSKPKGTNTRILGRSISTRPTSVNERESFGHWEADLMEGKIGKNEPVVLTLLERFTRFGISRKLPNGKSDTIQQALLEITTENTEAFSSITFDNGSEFSQAAALEDSSELDIKVYYCHAYASWERGSNELFNRQLREFIPKGISIHKFTAEEVSESAQWVNQRIRETIDYQSSADLFEKMAL